MNWQNVKIDWKWLLFTFINCGVFTVFMLVNPAVVPRLLKPFLERSTDPPPSPVVSRPSPTHSPPPVSPQPSPSPQVEATPSPIPELLGQLGQVSDSTGALRLVLQGMTRRELEFTLRHSGWRDGVDMLTLEGRSYLGDSWAAPDGNSHLFVCNLSADDGGAFAVALDAQQRPINSKGEPIGIEPRSV